MDVNETVANMRTLAADMHAWQDGAEDPDEPGEYYRIASEMVEGFDALDTWLSKGDFPPGDWIAPNAVRTLDLEKRAYRLRCALLEAGVPENLVRAVELGGEEQLELEQRLRTLHPRTGNLRTDAERRAQPEGLPRGVYREGTDL